MSLFHQILAVVDTSNNSHPELLRAMKLCKLNAAKLHLVDVVKDLGFTARLFSNDYAHIHELLVREKREGLTKLATMCEQEGISVTTEVIEGMSSEATVSVATRVGADLLIRSAKGSHSLAHGPLGASSQKLLRRLTCPLWLTHAAHEPTAKLMIAAVNATPNDDPHAELNRHIIRTALELARADDAQLLIVYAWSLYSAELLRHRLPPNEYEILMQTNRGEHEQSFDQLLSEFQLDRNSPGVRLLEGEPSECIPKLCKSQQADLFICGTISRRGIAGLLLGNTADRILNRIECSSLAITPSEATPS